VDKTETVKKTKTTDKAENTDNNETAVKRNKTFATIMMSRTSASWEQWTK
jgi:hypothetical protein